MRQVTINTKSSIPILFFLALTTFSRFIVMLVAVTLYTLILFLIEICVFRTVSTRIIWEVWFLFGTRSALLTQHVIYLLRWTWITFFLNWVKVKREKTFNALKSVPKRMAWALTNPFLFIQYQRILTLNTLTKLTVKICFILTLATRGSIEKWSILRTNQALLLFNIIKIIFLTRFASFCFEIKIEWMVTFDTLSPEIFIKRLRTVTFFSLFVQ